MHPVVVQSGQSKTKGGKVRIQNPYASTTINNRKAETVVMISAHALVGHFPIISLITTWQLARAPD